MDIIYDTVIVGAGPAGMTAAIFAAKKGRRVLLLERQELVGKKLLVTGNGRCNITNLDQKPEYYRSDAPERVWEIFSGYNEKDVISLMKKLGVLTKDRDGYVYPYNDQAASVREAFERYLFSLKGLVIKSDCTVTHILRKPDRQLFRVETGFGPARQQFLAVTVIIAAGGYAGVKPGFGGEGFRFAKELGHTLITPRPALTALTSKAPFLKKLAGVRCRAAIHLLINAEPVFTETGELQWTDYGISGVAVFSMSRFAIRAMDEEKRVSVLLDLLPDLTEEEVKSLLVNFRNHCGYKDCTALLNGIIAPKLVPVILREAEVDKELKAYALTDQELDSLTRTIKGFLLHIRGCKSYEKAQVTMGGVPLTELTGHLESKHCPGLFFAGEVIDVDGTCGGYNLQWAFASGKAAGTGVLQTRDQY